MLTVKASEFKGWVVFYERDKRHPSGVAIVDSAEPVAVYGTQAVLKAISTGQLVDVTKKREPKGEATDPSKKEGDKSKDATAK